MTIEPVDPGRLSQVAALMPLYMSEAYGAEWRGSEEALQVAAAEGTLRILVAANRAEGVAGFIAWTPAYDLHWCVAGGAVLDLYVCPEARGRAVAIRLLAAAAAQLRLDGGAFLRGTALDTGRGKALYGRTAVCNPTMECTLSGRAFRELAELEKLPARELVRRLPSAAWNYEA
jgi:GNAT superfamily N-acetyltransferase